MLSAIFFVFSLLLPNLSFFEFFIEFALLVQQIHASAISSTTRTSKIQAIARGPPKQP
jgi:hypothetical protein